MVLLFSVATTFVFVIASLAVFTFLNFLMFLWNGQTIEEIGQYYLGLFLVRICVKPATKAEFLRSQFNELPIPELRRAKDHTHPEAAADRSGASAFLDLLGRTLGYTPYFVQRSRSDERNEREGSRTHYWVKDLTAQVTGFNPPSDALLVFVDVDQYIDMPTLLTTQFKPTAIYTFQPHAVARATGEYSFTFNENDEVDYMVVGGGRYQHKVWNYGTDHLITKRYVSGILVSAAAFLVDRRKTSVDHEIVFLSPIAKWNFPFATYARFEGRQLQRLRVAHGKFLRLFLHQDKGPMVSTGHVGGYLEATIPVGVDEMISSLSMLSKTDLNKPQVMSYVEDHQAATMLVEYHRAHTGIKPDVVFPVPESIRRYQFEPKNYQPDAKPGLVAFMSPIVHGCFAPDMCIANERQAVQGRVHDMKSSAQVTPFLMKCMVEFVERLIPVPHQLHPRDVDEVWERQNRPSQRRIINDALVFGPHYSRLVNTFLKKEAYAHPNHPRIISTICGPDKVAYSCYMYAMADIYKEQDWYAFGRTPLETALRVSEICVDALEGVTQEDISRLDGSYPVIGRIFERLQLMRAFAHEYHEKLVELHKTQFGQTARTTNGVKYETENTRLSGSPETSVFNTGYVALGHYVGFRMTKRNGAYMNPDEAWSALGMYGGDDGITADISPDTLERAFKLLGLTMKVELVPRGCPGIQFLARCYSPDVWYGDLNSCCDIKRQLAKFHSTVHLPSNVPPEVKLLEKCRSFVLTDARTPIIGDLSSAVMLTAACFKNAELLAKYAVELKEMKRWTTSEETGEQYPNDAADWMIDLALKQMPTFDVRRFNQWLTLVVEANASDRDLAEQRGEFDPDQCLHYLTRFLSPPLCVDPEPPKLPTAPVVIDGDVLPAVKSIPPADGPAKKEKTKPKGGKGVSRKGNPKPPVKDTRRGVKPQNNQAKPAQDAKTPIKRREAQAKSGPKVLPPSGGAKRPQGGARPTDPQISRPAVTQPEECYTTKTCTTDSTS